MSREIHLEEALRALNTLVDEGVITDYAIGGAVGATFYVEALQTDDLDAFVFLPKSSVGIVLLGPIYEALAAHGGVPEREYIRFGDWPVQILTDANPLIADAIKGAAAVTFNGVPTRVFRAEHLVAIAVQTGRRKDQLRVAMFLEQSAVDLVRLGNLLQRYSLRDRFESWSALNGREGAA